MEAVNCVGTDDGPRLLVQMSVTCYDDSHLFVGIFSWAVWFGDCVSVSWR